MKFFNIIVHGVPYGQDIFSTDPIADESYIKTFYKQQDNPLETLFEIEARKEGNQQLVYYHYLKRRDVFDAEGRAGSYFGFTLRTDVSCDEMALLFHHMDEVFRTRILGSLLERAGNGYRHRVRKYSQGKSVVESMVKEFNDWLALPGILPLFHEVPACPQAKSESKVCNLEDYARYEVVKGALQKGMSMQLSPDVPRNAYLSKMAELNNQLATAAAQQKQAVELAKSESRDEMDRMNKSIQAQKTEIDRLNGEIDRLNGEINRLNGETNRLNEETDRLKTENARWKEAYEQKANEVQRLKMSEAQVQLLAFQAQIKQLIHDSLNLPETPRRGFHEKTSRRAARSAQTTAYAPDDEEERWHRTGVTPASLPQKLVRSRKFWMMVCAGLFLVVIVLGFIWGYRYFKPEKMSRNPVFTEKSAGDSDEQRAGRTANYSESELSTPESSNGEEESTPEMETREGEEADKPREQEEPSKAAAAKPSQPSKNKENSATSSHNDGKQKASPAAKPSQPSGKKGKSATSSHDDGKKNTSPAAKQSTKSEEKSGSGEDGDKPRK